MPKTMRAMVLTGIREMEERTVPMPEYGRNDVLLKMEAIGVCGSDLHYYLEGRIGSQVVEYPYPVGHESAATVAAVGAAVTGLAEGDPVAVDPAISCEQCDQCLANRPHTCRHLKFIGCPGQLPGCLSEYYVMPAKCCHKLSPGTDFGVGTLAEPASIGCYAVAQSIPMNDARVGVLGAGPVGLSVLAALRHAGAGAVYVSEPVAYRRALAMEMGAILSADPYDEDGLLPIIDREPLLLDVVFECAGEQDALDEAVRLLKPGGKLMLIGIPRTQRVSFNIDELRRREICIQNVRRQNRCMALAVELVENEELCIRQMITHEFPLAETKRAFDLLAEKADRIVKAIIYPGR